MREQAVVASLKVDDAATNLILGTVVTNNPQHPAIRAAMREIVQKEGIVGRNVVIALRILRFAFIEPQAFEPLPAAFISVDALAAMTAQSYFR